MSRLARAGFQSEFVRGVLFPDWWTDDCSKDASLLPDLEFRVARFLRETIEQVRAPATPLRVPGFEGAQLRHSRGLGRERLTPAIHAAVLVAEAVVRNLREPRAVQPLPPNAGEWRNALLERGAFPDLNLVVDDLWSRGIPVVQLEILPTPKFQGMALVLDGQPVILVGHGQDVPAWLLFTVAHESGHVASGDCERLGPIIDATEQTDTSDIEQAADAYAFLLLNGRKAPYPISGTDARTLAKNADKIERAHRVDAGHLILAWAREHNDFAKADRALAALWKKRSTGRLTLRRQFDANVDVDNASDTDKALLRCVALAPERDAGSH